MTGFPHAGPEPDTPANEEFRVRSRREVIAILDDAIARRVLMALHYQGSTGNLVTCLLRVNPEFEELVFDAAQSDEVNRALAASNRLVFVALIDHIKTQFSALRAEATMFEGRPALRTRLPESILRLQRRDFFRVPAPRAATFACEVTLPGGAIASYAVSDLSVGGLSMLVGRAHEGLEAGTVLENCRIALPGQGVITTTIEIRSRALLTATAPDSARIRFGCRFRNLPGTVANVIQRYINQVERNRRALT